MYTLKLVGLVVLASMSALGFIVGYGQFQDYQAHLEAQDSVKDIDEAVWNNFLKPPNPQDNFELEVKIPSGYQLRFEENSVNADGVSRPLESEGLYSYVEDNFSSGVYTLEFSWTEDNGKYLIEVGRV